MNSPHVINWLGVIPKSIVQAGSEDLAGSFYPQSLFSYAHLYDIEFREVSNLASYLKLLFLRANSKPFFVFHLQLWHLIPIILSRFFPVCLYYQNRWPQNMPFLKACVYRALISLVSCLAVQDSCCYTHFSRYYPKKRIVLLPWFVDGSFFSPIPNEIGASSTLSELHGRPFILIPGDRSRDLQLLRSIAKKFPFTYVRVSRSLSLQDIKSLSEIPGVKHFSFVTYSDLLWLYQNCLMVLNLVDDRFDSAGMTVLFEALASNTPVLTPAGHSSSGYVFNDDSDYIRLVKDCNNEECWATEIRTLVKLPDYRHSEKGEIRNLFDQRLSARQIFMNWTSIATIS